ncbi:MAG TPA: conjugal transfer protein TraF [Gallionella sp.]
MQKSWKFFATSALLASCGTAFAVPFNSIDPRSMAMGGAGVAVGDAKMAPFFNPALLTVTPEDDDFTLALPIVGVRAYDPQDFATSLDDFQNGNYVSNLDASISTYNAAKTSANLSAISSNTTTLSTQFTTLSDKPIQAELGAAMVVGIPSKSLGAAFFANGWGAAGGVIKYRDNQTLADLAYAMDTVAACQTTPTPSCLTTIATDPRIQQYYDPVTQTVTFNTTQLQSSVDIRGVAMSEIGVALSSEFSLGDSYFGLGLTPKMVRTTLFDYSADVNSSNTGNATDSDYTAKYSGFNFDLGLAKDFENGWRSGLSVKNVLPKSYDFKRIATGSPAGSPQITTGTLKLKPQARVGVSHSNSWSTVAMDLDLTANDPAGFENQSQYLALGGELNAWGWAQLRAGYRANLKDTKRNVTSIGVGLGPLDITVAGNSNEYGASLSLGFTF